MYQESSLLDEDIVFAGESPEAPARRLSRSNRHRASNGAAVGSFMAEVEPVIEEYEKVVAGLEERMAAANRAQTHAEEELRQARDEVKFAERVQHANMEVISTLRKKNQHLEEELKRTRERERENWRLSAVIDDENAQALRQRLNELETVLQQKNWEINVLRENYSMPPTNSSSVADAKLAYPRSHRI
jgi:chromosome segregation ATPase